MFALLVVVPPAAAAAPIVEMGGGGASSTAHFLTPRGARPRARAVVAVYYERRVSASFAVFSCFVVVL